MTKLLNQKHVSYRKQEYKKLEFRKPDKEYQ